MGMSPEDRAATLAATPPADRAAALAAMSPADREATLAACFRYEGALRSLNDQKEPEICRILRFFEFASEGLKADKEIVMAAMTSDGAALEFASEGLKADKEFMIAAMTSIPR